MGKPTRIFGTSLKGLDAFGKTLEDVRVRTKTGALLTFISLALIGIFSLAELADWWRVDLDTYVIVDRTLHEKLTVNLNLTFPRVPCFLLALDVMDVSGKHLHDVSHNIIKTRLDKEHNLIPDSHHSELKNELDKQVEFKKQNYCGSCYGGLEPESGCCNTCDDVRQAYVNRGWAFGDPDAIDQCKAEHWTEKIKSMADEGCNIAGKVRVPKVVGNIAFSAGRSFQTVNMMTIMELVPYLRDGKHHDFGHWIHRFAFEADDEYHPDYAKLTDQLKRRLGVVVNPLDGTSAHTEVSDYMFQYFLKVVPTEFYTLEGDKVNSQQYSVSGFDRDLGHGQQEKTVEGFSVTHGMLGIPGAFFSFDVSPMRVVHKEVRKPLADVLTAFCAIIGGILTVTSLVDAAIHHARRYLKNPVANGHSNGNGNGHGIH